jgi:hypothetical protein
MTRVSDAQQPEANSDPQTFLSCYSPPVRALALELRALVLELIPGVIEQVDLPARLLAYGYDRTYKGTICVIMPLKGAVNLGFARGVDLSDPADLLAGTGKRARHVRITASEQVHSSALSALLEAAAAITSHGP